MVCLETRVGQMRLVKELRCNEPEDFRYYLRMDSGSFEVKFVTPYAKREGHQYSAVYFPGGAPVNDPAIPWDGRPLRWRSEIHRCLNASAASWWRRAKPYQVSALGCQGKQMIVIHYFTYICILHTYLFI